MKVREKVVDRFLERGIGGGRGGMEASDAEWQRVWHVNVMARVDVAHAVLPSMLAAGRGYFLHTASAAGLLAQIGSAPYAVTASSMAQANHDSRLVAALREVRHAHPAIPRAVSPSRPRFSTLPLPDVLLSAVSSS